MLIVQLVRWAARGRSHRGYYRQYPLRVFLPRLHGVVRCADSAQHQHRAGP